jgi:hypothetical protein
MAADIQRAFSLAAQKRSPVLIVIDTANKAFYVRNRGLDTTYVATIYNAASDMGLLSMQATQTSITIYPNGLASTPFMITANTAGNTRQVSATRAGQVRITSP